MPKKKQIYRCPTCGYMSADVFTLASDSQSFDGGYCNRCVGERIVSGLQKAVAVPDGRNGVLTIEEGQLA